MSLGSVSFLRYHLLECLTVWIVQEEIMQLKRSIHQVAFRWFAFVENMFADIIDSHVNFQLKVWKKMKPVEKI